jgi:hypothetical protein
MSPALMLAVSMLLSFFIWLFLLVKKIRCSRLTSQRCYGRKAILWRNWQLPVAGLWLGVPGLWILSPRRNSAILPPK